VKLYHGTSETVARAALKEGLQPRCVTKRDSNWRVESRSDVVYLTTAYVGSFAFHACKRETDAWGILEIDTEHELFDKTLLVPDEDYLEQASRRHHVIEGHTTMEDRTRWFRQRLEEFAHLWPNSLEGLGNCAYMGAIPPQAITRAAIYNPSANPGITLACLDPEIRTLNYAICGEKYRTLTRWLLGYNVRLDEVLLWDLMRPTQQQRDRMMDQSGVQLIKGG
jgi:hypothetical protein